MIKLTSLLNEVRIVPFTDKAKLIDDIADYDLYLLSTLTYSDSNLSDFLDHFGYNDMQEYIDNEPEESVKFTESYLKHIKPGEVYRISNTSTPVAGYKMVKAWSRESEELDDLIILTKF
jgi:hypothetical protein